MNIFTNYVTYSCYFYYNSQTVKRAVVKISKFLTRVARGKY